MRTLRLLVLGAGLAWPTLASADQCDFSFDGTFSAHFTLDCSPTPGFVSDGAYFVISPVQDTVNSDYYRVAFINNQYYSGLDFEIIDGAPGSFAQDLIGPQLYTGSEANPTFRLGNYSLTGFGSVPPASLIISAHEGTVPEPTSWAMMLVGLGAVGVAFRRRRLASQAVRYS